MKYHKLLHCGLLAAVLGIAPTADCQAENVVNEARIAIEFKYGEWRPEGLIWSDPVTIPSGYMLPIPNERQYYIVAIWRPAGTPGDGGWSFVTGLDRTKTGYIGDLLLIEFK